ncbi:MAG TPA: DUF3343 domain-containing protein [Syntrophorhabdaceae bacterium]|nr:DUF3343 domain-containing protein [Syntrophorhabdaceae bacterium]HQM82125.1 DUF3343 domain-containing protein [Syntrophorhabdaceae bacterium]
MIYFLIFLSIHDVLKAEKALKGHNVDMELVPVPRNLSSDCGMCIKLKGGFDDVKPYLDGIELEKCVSYDGEEYRTIES